jgi:hypothetical protein
VDFRSNICEYFVNKEHTTTLVFRTHTKLKIFIQTPHIKSKFKYFLLAVTLNFLLEKCQRIHRMIASWKYLESHTGKGIFHYSDEDIRYLSILNTTLLHNMYHTNQ